MSFLSILRTGIKAMIDDANTPESFKIGEKFEKYVREVLFPESQYTLVERTHNYSTNHKDYVEASLKPDFTFRDRKTNKEFYLEVKVRTTTFNNKIVWCNQKQLDRYFEYHKQKPVFVVLDCGDDSNPYISLIPLNKAKYTGLFPSYAKQFEIEDNKPVTSKILWDR
jgi:hypothetical protein